LPDHRAAMRSSLSRSFSPTACNGSPPQPLIRSVCRLGDPCPGQPSGDGVFDVRDVTSYNVVTARLGPSSSLLFRQLTLTLCCISAPRPRSMMRRR
jgi:hypothetical protein